MRDILFRGKHTKSSEFVEGSLLVFPNTGRTKILRWNQADLDFDQIEVIPKTVGQYTGSTDKNGKCIFEGDILQFDYIGKNLGVNGISFVSFQNSKFGVEWGCHKEFVCLDGFSNTTIEIIGNIHDNPELLGGKND